MLERLAHFLVRRRRFVLVGTLVFLVFSGAIGGKVQDYLYEGGFESPDSDSTHAVELLRTEFKQAPPNVLLLVYAKEGTVNDGAVRKAGLRVTADLTNEPGISQVVSHFAIGPASPLQSRDKTKALILAEIAGDEDEAGGVADRLRTKYTFDEYPISVRVGGFQALFREVSEIIETDLRKGEGLAGLITMPLLIVFFGSLIAALLPLGVGVVAIFGTFFILRLVAGATDVSTFALPMVTAMGLGLGIDYSLFIVSRFREELAKGHDTETAVVNTVRTAGRTIIFSGVTVAVSLAALLVFPMVFFKSFGYAGIGVVAMAVLGAVIFLPAVLAMLGPRVDKLSLWKRHPKPVGEGAWHKIAMFVMRRPVPVASAVVVFLLLLGVPFLHANIGLPDERVVPTSASTRRVHDTIRRDFPTEEVQSLRVVATEIGNPFDRRKDIGTYAAELSTLPGVGRVDSFDGLYIEGRKTRAPTPLSGRYVTADATWFQVIPSVDPMSQKAEAIVDQIRTSDAPFEQVLVGGASAELVDVKAAVFSALPWAIGIISIATFVLLFLMFGSLLVPVKALVLNFLSLTATFGAMVWIFQDGHLSGFLGFTPSGTLDISSPILMFCIAFGLSMDYEVFLLSRIKEEYDATGDNERSVAIGLERTGRIVTAAAVLISVVFLAIGTSSVRFIKLFGIGMALAVLMDAFVIRGTLVPAFMRLAGNANWWLPPALRRFHARFEMKEVTDVEPVAEGIDSGPQPSRPRTPRKPAPKRKPAAPKRKPAAAKRKPVASKKKKPAAARGKTTAKR